MLIALHTALWLACWGFVILGIWTVADWTANKLTGTRHKIRVVSRAEYQKVVNRNIVDGEEVADLCVKALERAYKSMREDPKLAEREIEYVLEQIDAA